MIVTVEIAQRAKSVPQGSHNVQYKGEGHPHHHIQARLHVRVVFIHKPIVLCLNENHCTSMNRGSEFRWHVVLSVSVIFIHKAL